MIASNDVVKKIPATQRMPVGIDVAFLLNTKHHSPYTKSTVNTIYGHDHSSIDFYPFTVPRPSLSMDNILQLRTVPAINILEAGNSCKM